MWVKSSRMKGTWRWGIWQGGETHSRGINSAPMERKQEKKKKIRSVEQTEWYNSKRNLKQE